MDKLLLITFMPLLCYDKGLVQSLPIGSVECSMRGYNDPTHGWQNCSVLCHPNRTKAVQIKFCNDNCPNFYTECGFDLSQATLSTSTLSTKRKSSDLSQSFYPSTASPHISHVFTDAEVGRSSTELNRGDVETSPKTSYLLPIVFGTSLAVAVVLFVGFVCFMRRKRSRTIRNPGRACCAPLARKTNRKLRPIITQETKEPNQSEYMKEMVPSLARQPDFYPTPS